MPQQDDASAAIVSFAYEAGQLKNLPRSGWLRAGIKNPESVADHSFRVAVLAYLHGARDNHPDRDSTRQNSTGSFT
jgi:putative hydrolase of HD superfamily